MKPYYQDGYVTIYHEDCREILPDLPQVDLVLTDPPYGINFMGKDWDKALPGVQIWRECLRVLKPGGFAFVMSIPRADCLSRMIISLEDAGFLVNFTPIYWAYASGFPKAMSVSKAVDKYARRDYVRIAVDLGFIIPSNSLWDWTKGEHTPSDKWWMKFKAVLSPDQWQAIEREVIGSKEWSSSAHHFVPGEDHTERVQLEETAPSTPRAKALDGSYGGFQPKPAVEVIIVAMKPMDEKTYVDQALKNGHGITWLDDCRVPHNEPIKEMAAQGRNTGNQTYAQGGRYEPTTDLKPSGRFPANLLCSDDVLNDGKISQNFRPNSEGNEYKSGLDGEIYGKYNKPTYRFTAPHDSGSFSRYFDLDAWWAERIKELPESIQKTFPFLIVPKASKREKNQECEDLPEVSHATDYGRMPKKRCNVCGCMTAYQNRPGYELTCGHNDCEWLKPKEDGKHKGILRNHHPTVKPLKLMSYLITLGSRPGDTVLDSFLGSGTTAVAAKALRRKCIGIETDEQSCEIAANRCRGVAMELGI